MHTIKLQVNESIYSHIMFFLKNLNSKELQILEDVQDCQQDTQELKAFTDHSAHLVDDWKDESEDAIWR
ncbi:MAG: hypothetical protein RBR54_09450 [Sulfurimonas sp.]|jgi:hypothetical protein|nr:hypothetical protein [Sulfurimonas sp.]